MKSLFEFNSVIDRAKNAFNIKEDKELAEFIGLSAGSFGNRKRAQSLPYEELLIAANKQNVNFDWLLTGEGHMYRNANQVQDLKASYGVKAEVKSSLLDDVKILERFANLEQRIAELEHGHG